MCLLQDQGAGARSHVPGFPEIGLDEVSCMDSMLQANSCTCIHKVYRNSIRLEDLGTVCIHEQLCTICNVTVTCIATFGLSFGL